MSTPPVPPQSDKTALYIALGIGGGFLFLCVAPAIIIVVCLAAIQLLGQNSSTLFQTVATSIGTTADPGDPRLAEQEAKASADVFLTFLLNAQYDQALARTTPEYRKTISAQALRQMWDSEPALRRRADLTYTLNWQPGTATQQTFLAFWTNDTELVAHSTVEMTRNAAGVWEVSRFTMR